MEKAIEADWEGAAIAQPPVEWPERYAMLSGSELETVSCSDIAADTRELDCEAEVSGGAGRLRGTRRDPRRARRRGAARALGHRIGRGRLGRATAPAPHRAGPPTVLGTADLFSTAYGNVGSSIYYALGVTAIYALGMTPITFAISGVIFAFTAATYAEATARFPEAGGSASFARRAFNEGVSFFAAWAQMLNYTVTIAISAFTVPAYLAIFPGLAFMGSNSPGQLPVAACLCLLLALLNIRGIQESARLNILLALADLGTQALLVVVGAVLIRRRGADRERALGRGAARSRRS